LQPLQGAKEWSPDQRHLVFGARAGYTLASGEGFVNHRPPISMSRLSLPAAAGPPAPTNSRTPNREGHRRVPDLSSCYKCEIWQEPRHEFR
jgi:hypothetical protein